MSEDQEFILQHLKLPKKYKKLRDNQLDSAQKILKAFEKSKIVFFRAPTGSGKSLCSEIVAKFFSTSIFVTRSHTLEEQYADDGLRRLDGKGNFECLIKENTRVNKAPCVLPSFHCPSKGICPYFVQKDKALQSDSFVTNYSWLLSYINQPMNSGTIHRGLAVLDEAKSLLNVLIDVNTIILDSFVKGLADEPTKPINWPEYTTVLIAKLEALNSVVRDINYYEERRALISKLKEYNRDPYNYVITDIGNDKTLLKPKTVNNAMITNLFDIADKFLLMSATFPNDVSPLAKLLNLPYLYESIDGGTPIAASQRRIKVVGELSISSQRKESLLETVPAIERILNMYSVEKGMIYAHTNEFAHIIRDNISIAHKHRLVTHESRGLLEALKKHKQRKDNSVLLTTSAGSHGISLDDEQARFLIVAKFPFYDLADEWILAQPEEYRVYEMVSDFMQICGRVVRGPKDYATVYVLDAVNFRRFYTNYRHLFPVWFQQAVYLDG